MLYFSFHFSLEHVLNFDFIWIIENYQILLSMCTSINFRLNWSLILIVLLSCFILFQIQTSPSTNLPQLIFMILFNICGRTKNNSSLESRKYFFEPDRWRTWKNWGPKNWGDAVSWYRKWSEDFLQSRGISRSGRWCWLCRSLAKECWQEGIVLFWGYSVFCMNKFEGLRHARVILMHSKISQCNLNI